MDFYELVKTELIEVEMEMEQLIPKEPKEVYNFIVPFFQRGGKRIRPALTIIYCAALGGDISKAILPATIIELFHNFTLIHDDIEDNSLMRRGQPTLHVSHGIPIALNSGDAFYTLIWDVINNLDWPPQKLIELQRMYSSSFRRVVEGQGIELAWYRDDKFDITEKDYFAMISGKTAALIGLSCELGGYLVGVDKKKLLSLRRFGEKLGLAFQIQDDILNIIGDFKTYKKEIAGDITEGKRTLMVVRVFEKATFDEKEQLRKILSSNTRDEKELNTVVLLFKKYNSIDYARTIAMKFTDEAKKEISWLPETKYKKALIRFADFVVNREQ
ncbi:MAG: polyprenyl synthetase family protein [Candidatus Micrarchaeota archaeon]|nr:polyprenyl synthetase family protein [Candidatus Micrarchaeota archaeon]